MRRPLNFELEADGCEVYEIFRLNYKKMIRLHEFFHLKDDSNDFNADGQPLNWERNTGYIILPLSEFISKYKERGQDFVDIDLWCETKECVYDLTTTEVKAFLSGTDVLHYSRLTIDTPCGKYISIENHNCAIDRNGLAIEPGDTVRWTDPHPEEDGDLTKVGEVLPMPNSEVVNIWFEDELGPSGELEALPSECEVILEENIALKPWKYNAEICQLFEESVNEMLCLAADHGISHIDFSQHPDIDVFTARFEDKENLELCRFEDIKELIFDFGINDNPVITIIGDKGSSAYFDALWGDFIDVADSFPKVYEMLVRYIEKNKSR